MPTEPKLPWPDCQRYMRMLYELQRWVDLELNRVQIDQHVGATLPAAWDRIEIVRGELLDGLEQQVNGDR